MAFGVHVEVLQFLSCLAAVNGSEIIEVAGLLPGHVVREVRGAFVVLVCGVDELGAPVAALAHDVEEVFVEQGEAVGAAVGDAVVDGLEITRIASEAVGGPEGVQGVGAAAAFEQFAAAGFSGLPIDLVGQGPVALDVGVGMGEIAVG